MGTLACFLVGVSLVEWSCAGDTQPVALGQACEAGWEPGQCFVSDSNSECDIGNTDTCICTTNYVEESAVCKVKVDGLTECGDTDECPSNATCAGHCICNSGYTEASFLCTAVVGMGCTLNSQCTDVQINTVCSSFQCACVSGYRGNTCTDFVIGMVCTNDCDCQDVLSNTVCMSSQCECASGFSGLACSSAGTVKLSKTTTIHCLTILLTVMYKCLI